jgi:hypothetical protein
VGRRRKLPDTYIHIMMYMTKMITPIIETDRIPMIVPTSGRDCPIILVENLI